MLKQISQRPKVSTEVGTCIYQPGLSFFGVPVTQVLAAAILVFREGVLLSATTPSDVELVLEDFSELKAIPLLQDFLFSDDSILPS